MDQPGRPPVISKDYVRRARSQYEEDAYDFVAPRQHPNPITFCEAVMHMVKGALGAGVLSGHVSYMTAGVFVAVVLNIAFGIYMGICLYLLVSSAQILYRRTKIHTMTYADVGEAAVTLFPHPKIKRFAKCFRYIIDGIIIIDLFGACTTYQLIIAGTIKQLVENVQESQNTGLFGYPHIRVYMAALIIPYILICWLVHLKWLAPFTLYANVLILLCLGVAMYYASVYNPKFVGMKPYTSIYNTIHYCGMIVFAMSCAGVVMPVENVMRNPNKFGEALVLAMTIVILIMVLMSVFGYSAFLENSKSPITINFPMTMFNKLLKGFMACMMYVTHAVNFWVPFNCAFYYLKRCHTSRFMMWELIYRALFVILIAVLGIVFPSVEALMGFLGNFCLTNIAFVFPNIINLLTIWHRPGLGTYRWRLWRGVLFITIGLFLWVCGSLVTAHSLVHVFRENIKAVSST